MQRLLDLVLESSDDTAAYKPISNLARRELRTLSGRIKTMLDECGGSMDAYTNAHLTETKERIDRALEAGYTYNTGSGQQPMMMLLLGKEGQLIEAPGQ